MFRNKSSTFQNENSFLSSVISHNDNLINSSKQFIPFNNTSYTEPNKGNKPLLPPKSPNNKNKKTLILDLDETLVHSGFSVNTSRPSDITITININNKNYKVYIFLRPGIEQFLKETSEYYEIVIFTASLKQYAEPVIDKMDPNKYCSHRLYREHCYLMDNIFIKDLRNIGRDMKDVIIIDNNPGAYSLNVENGIPIKTWMGDIYDRELFKIKILLEKLSTVADVRDYIQEICNKNVLSFSANSFNSDNNNYNFETYPKKKDEQSQSQQYMKYTYNSLTLNTNQKKVINQNHSTYNTQSKFLSPLYTERIVFTPNGNSSFIKRERISNLKQKIPITIPEKNIPVNLIVQKKIDIEEKEKRINKFSNIVIGPQINQITKRGLSEQNDNERQILKVINLLPNAFINNNKSKIHFTGREQRGKTSENIMRTKEDTDSCKTYTEKSNGFVININENIGKEK